MLEWGELPAHLRNYVISQLQHTLTRHKDALNYYRASRGASTGASAQLEARERRACAKALRAAIRVLEREGRK